MRVLVTGGAGFIGSHVVDALRAAGHEPRVFDVRPSPHHAPGEIDTHLGDVLDPESLRAALEGCDAVAHLAAAADVDQVTESPASAEELNARGTLNVLQAAREAGVSRVLYASTIWVYGACEGEGPVDESTPLGAPDHLYTATKLGGEMYCSSYAAQYGLDCTILRFGIPYGPRARPAAVIPAFVRKALAGDALTIAGTGEQCRRFIYVEDLAEGVARALRPEAANRVYNLVGDEDVSIKRIAETVSDLVGDTVVVHTPARTGDFRGVEVSGELAERELGWRPRTPFAEGVERYLHWHRHDAPAAEQPPPAAAEHPSRPAAAGAASRRAGRRLADALAPAGFFAGAVGLLAAYFVSLHAVGGEPARTLVLGMSVVLVLSPALLRRREGGRGPSAVTLAWVLAAAGTLAALVLPDPRHLLGIADTDAVQVLLGVAGAGFALALGAGGRRLLPGWQPDEQPHQSRR